MSTSSPPTALRKSFILAMILSAGCWGLGTVMSKSALHQFPPLALLIVQLIASVLFLWVVVILQRDRSTQTPIVTGRTLRLALSGVLEPGLAYTLGHVGLAMTTASNVTLIGTTEPVIILGLAGLVLREPIRLPLLGCSIVAIAGVLITVGVNPQVTGSSLLGDTLVALGTICAASYVIASRHSVSQLAPLPLAALQQTVGLGWVALVGGAIGRWLEPQQSVSLAAISPASWGVALTAGIVQFSLAFWLYLIALRGIPASIAAQFLALIPLFGVCGAYLFLGERFTTVQGLGMGLTVLAVGGITQLKSQDSPQPHGRTL